MTYISVIYNGDMVHTQTSTIAELLRQQGIDASTKGIAVAQNATVIPRKMWHETPVQDGDTVEVVKPFQGG